MKAKLLTLLNGIDGKYDLSLYLNPYSQSSTDGFIILISKIIPFSHCKLYLNLDHVPILSIVAKNNANFATLIAFVDCDHAWYYEDLPDNNGFRKITKLDIDGRCRSKEDALSMTILFNIFINNLDMNNEKKDKIKNDIKNNWICEEKLMRENITEEHTGKLVYKAGLVNVQSIEQKDLTFIPINNIS
ncbi:hypothetical protein C1645_836955 [Glomus cerebriforme]|uniref:Uncharacterized protein n=1 Tax=Glomus cerebriforme TaxID=658196 RepID=A0A397SGA8_9GLOM|nr:hypothetical protein C1645_836955 [Glomus cerebriforme]